MGTKNSKRSTPPRVPSPPRAQGPIRLSVIEVVMDGDPEPYRHTQVVYQLAAPAPGICHLVVENASGECWVYNMTLVRRVHMEPSRVDVAEPGSLLVRP